MPDRLRGTGGAPPTLPTLVGNQRRCRRRVAAQAVGRSPVHPTRGLKIPYKGGRRPSGPTDPLIRDTPGGSPPLKRPVPLAPPGGQIGSEVLGGLRPPTRPRWGNSVQPRAGAPPPTPLVGQKGPVAQGAPWGGGPPPPPPPQNPAVAPPHTRPPPPPQPSSRLPQVGFEADNFRYSL
jgi:hypothetical protein